MRQKNLTEQAGCSFRLFQPNVIRAGVVAIYLLVVAWTFPLLAEDEGQKSDVKEDSQWITLFDGKSIEQWEVLKKVDFEEHGKVHLQDKCLIIESGSPATGARWTGKYPTMDYELTLEARRIQGGDFFCGLTFPVKDTGMTLIMGGWSGWVVGLSCIDGFYAIDNETCTAVEFENGRWYRVRLRVTEPKIEVWVDDKQVIEFETEGHKLAVSDEMKPCLPLGIATWRTTGGIRSIRYRLLNDTPIDPEEVKPE